MKCNAEDLTGCTMGKHYSHLSMEERNDIHQFRNEGFSLRAIARRPSRPTSTTAQDAARNTIGTSYELRAATGLPSAAAATASST